MSSIYPQIDPDGLMEYSVVYTDRALNHMSRTFQEIMREISSTLKVVYKANVVAVVPGSGTFGMEAVARQFAVDKKCLVIRNGWFSYRWTQIFKAGNIPAKEIVLKARQTGRETTAPFIPPPVDEVVAAIQKEKPDLVFAPHVETSSGMILPDEYIQMVGHAVREAGGLFVLDCIASGTVWVDMKQAAVDILISAPQKGWSGTPCAALIMMNDRARQQLDNTSSNSFACDLAKWLWIMEMYENGGHAYHATMPTDGLGAFSDAMNELKQLGFEPARSKQVELGANVRSLLAKKGFESVAADGYEAPGVVVCYTDDPMIKNGSKFAELGIQIAAGVPLQCGEPEGFSTFRLGLFGLDKLQDITGTVARLENAMDKILT